MDNTTRDQLRYLQTETGRKLFMGYYQGLNDEQKIHFVHCSFEQRQFLFFNYLHRLSLKFPFQEFMNTHPIAIPAIIERKNQ